MPEQALVSRIPHEALVSLRHRLATLPARHPDRKNLVANAAAPYGLSRSTLYRGLRQQPRSSRCTAPTAAGPRSPRRPSWSAGARRSRP